MCVPMVENVDTVVDTVRRNGMAALSASNIAWTRNEYGPCVNVTGYGSVRTGCLSSQFFMDNFTFMMWAATTDSAVTKEWGMGFYSGASLAVYMGRQTNEPKIAVLTAGGLTSASGTATGNNDGNTHCLCGVSSPSKLRMYYEGEEIGNELPADNEQGDATAIWVGETNVDEYWPGTISFAAIWNRPLSYEEVRTLYRMGPGLQILSEEIISPFSAAIGAGTPTFIPAWAYNSNQVL